MREMRRILIFIALDNDVSAVSQDVESDLEAQVLRAAAVALAADTNDQPDPQTYALIEWESLDVLPPTLKIADIPPPGIVMVLPDRPQTIQATALGLKTWIEQGTMRREVEKHLAAPPTFILSRSGPARLGSREHPFASAQALLSFLEESHPEQFVFRGQVRAYDGPLLPSGFRGRVTPLKVSGEGPGPFPFAVVSHSSKEINEKRREKIVDHVETLRHAAKLTTIRDGVTAWDLPEADYRRAYSSSLQTSYENATASKASGETCVRALIELFGEFFAMVLSQQYGLTSSLLDASTNPRVAVFFATHVFPYYEPGAQKDHLGVVYRWPREQALLGEDHMKLLEGDKFESVGRSFRQFVDDSKDLEAILDNTTIVIDDEAGQVRIKEMQIRVHGPERALASLRFPRGAFERSRIGRQGGAYLNPRAHTQAIGPSQLSGTTHSVALVGDLMETHRGKAFFFRHTGELPDLGPIDKFHLWPVDETSTCALDFTGDRATPIALENPSFQDPYLELLVRLLSPWSPVQLRMSRLRDGDWETYVLPLRTLVDPGFAIHPREARTIAQRILETRNTRDAVDVGRQGRDAYDNLLRGPISLPVPINIPSDVKDEFYRCLAAAARDLTATVR